MNSKVSYLLFWGISTVLQGCHPNPKNNYTQPKSTFAARIQGLIRKPEDNTQDTFHETRVLASSNVVSIALLNAAPSQEDNKSNNLETQPNLAIKILATNLARKPGQDQKAIPAQRQRANSPLANQRLAKVADHNTLAGIQDSWMPVHATATNSNHNHFNTAKLHRLASGDVPHYVTGNELTPLRTPTIAKRIEVATVLPKIPLLTQPSNRHANKSFNWADLEEQYLQVIPPLPRIGSIQEFHTSDNPPLHIATINGDLEAVTLLLDEGIDPNITNDLYGYTALHRAAYYGHLTIAQLLIDKGANPHLTDKSGYVPLHWAVMNGHLDIVSLLLDKQVNPDIVDQDGFTPLHWAARHGYVVMATLLLAKGANPNSISQSGYALLHWAAMQGHLDVIEMLIAKNANVHIADKSGYTALHWAAKGGHLEIIKLLLKQGIAPNITAKNGYTPLYWAATHGHLDIVKLLLDVGADLHIAGVKSLWQ
jgi:ankyrin repeat protein